jgi:gamma-glutamyltranspeptidase/glutathione hydrolase
MAATSHPLATLAAIDVLRAGGSAADAAVTAGAALCVVEPHMTGIGGDCFCLVSQPGKPVWGYNGCGRAGASASDAALRAKGMEAIGMTSVHAVTVPGAVDAGTRSYKRTAASILRARCNRRSNMPRAASRWRSGWPPIGKSRWPSSRPIPAPPNIACSTARRRKKATSSALRHWPKR